MEIGSPAALETVAPASGGAAGRAAPSDALLAEILPTPVNSEAVQQALPGPQTSGMGLVPGPGAGGGGGGGSGGGVGGGVGRGVGPGTEFFGAREHAHSFVYVIDCSGSMATRSSLEIAKRELISSLEQLPPDAQFGVIFYNLRATVFSDPTGRKGLMAATRWQQGAGRHPALPDLPRRRDRAAWVPSAAALTLKPEVIFFLTDGDNLTRNDVAVLLTETGPVRIQTVEFGRGLDLGFESNPLRRLATQTGGTYRYIDVTSFPRGALKAAPVALAGQSSACRLLPRGASGRLQPALQKKTSPRGLSKCRRGDSSSTPFRNSGDLCLILWIAAREGAVVSSRTGLEPEDQRVVRADACVSTWGRGFRVWAAAGRAVDPGPPSVPFFLGCGGFFRCDVGEPSCSWPWRPRWPPLPGSMPSRRLRPCGGRPRGRERLQVLSFLNDDHYNNVERGALFVVLLIAVAGLAYAGMLVGQVVGADQGTPKMQQVATAIRQGANAYLGRQARAILVLLLILTFLVYFSAQSIGEVKLGRAAAFAMGAVFSWRSVSWA